MSESYESVLSTVKHEGTDMVRALNISYEAVDGIERKHLILSPDHYVYVIKKTILKHLAANYVEAGDKFLILNNKTVSNITVSCVNAILVPKNEMI